MYGFDSHFVDFTDGWSTSYAASFLVLRLCFGYCRDSRSCKIVIPMNLPTFRIKQMEVASRHMYIFVIAAF